MSRKEQVEVPFGYFRPGTVLMTRDLNPLQPRILELKFYARGIGPVLAVGISGGSDREELDRLRQAEVALIVISSRSAISGAGKREGER